jgi:hypothetical protein
VMANSSWRGEQQATVVQVALVCDIFHELGTVVAQFVLQCQPPLPMQDGQKPDGLLTKPYATILSACTLIASPPARGREPHSNRHQIGILCPVYSRRQIARKLLAA